MAILADLYFRLEQRLDRLLLDGPTGMIDEFTQRCSTLGHRVRVTLEEQGVVQGIAESIGPDGCLCLRVVSDTDAALAWFASRNQKRGSSPCAKVNSAPVCDKVTRCSLRSTSGIPT